MRCLYCGKELALFKRLRGGEFCSDAHRQRYQEEYTQLALNRLLQANSPKDGDKDAKDDKSIDANGKPGKGGFPSEPDSPALKRRDKLREEMPAAALPSPLSASPSISTPAAAAHAGPAAPQTAVLEPEPVAAVIEETPQTAPATEPISAPDEPPVAGMTSFIVEFPVPAVAESPGPSGTAVEMSAEQAGHAPELPRLFHYRPDPDLAHLDPAARVGLSLFTVADFPTPPRERGLELREFVRGAPPVEMQVKPAVESGFAPIQEALEVNLEALPPSASVTPWLASEVELPHIRREQEILLGEMARLDFELTSWGEAGAPRQELAAPPPPKIAEPPLPAELVSVPKPVTVPEPSLPPEPPVMGPAPLEALRPEPTKPEPVRPNSVTMEPFSYEPPTAAPSRPSPLRFEPVQIDPMFLERIAGRSIEVVPKTVATAPKPVEPAPAPAVVKEQPKIAEIAVPEQAAAPLPPNITKPLPVTLHGLAPMRGKPVQVFTAATLRPGDLQIPRATGLPLRPVMVLGPALKPSRVVQPPARPVPVAEKPVLVKTQPKPEPPKAETFKPELSKSVAPEPQVRKVESKPEVKSEVKSEAETEVKKDEAPKKVSEVKPAEALKPAEAPKKPSTEIESLGLPTFVDQKETFWSKLPISAKLGALAAVLALVGGGIFLTSRGSGSVKPADPVATEPVYVEEPALANTAGWEQDWFADRAGTGKGRHVDVLRGSMAQRDYRLVFEGQIQSGALSWVFRAADKSYYVEKVQLITPGREPMVALVHFAVINGQEQARTQVPLPIQAHLDTDYKVRMDVIGDRFTTWVQDQKADQWNDAQIAAGGVGLYYENGESAKLRDTLNLIPLKRK